MTEEIKVARGRPTKYKTEYAELAYKYCLLGATDEQMAEFFEVAIGTIYNWKNDHPDFLNATKKGKQVADATVAESLFKKATGFEHEAVKIFNDQGEPLIVPYTERFAPDTAAMIFWLKNRQPKLWRDKQEVDLSSTDGSMSPRGLDDYYADVAKPSAKDDDDKAVTES